MAEVTVELGMQAFGLKNGLGLTHSSRGYFDVRIADSTTGKGV